MSRPASPKLFSGSNPSLWAVKIADQVRPTDLAAGGVEVVVGPPTVGAGDAAKPLPEDGSRLALVAVGSDAKERRPLAQGAPERTLSPAQAPAGLVDVDHRRRADVVLKPRMGLFECHTGVLHDRIDRAGREPATEQLTNELDRVAAGDAVSDRQGGDGRLEAGTESAAGNVGRQLGARAPAADRTAQAEQAVLAELDRDLGQLRHLVAGGLAERLALLRLEQVTAAAARGPVLHDPADRGGRHQCPPPARMAGLGAPLTRGRRRRGRARSCPRRILAWRHGGVA